MNQLLFFTTDLPDLAVVAGILILAYALFALLGFGTALIASTPLAWVLPVARVVPLLALLDAVGAMQRGWHSRQWLDRSALARLLPAMLLGQILGVSLLARLPQASMAMLLGGFVAAYGLWSLWEGRRVAPPSSRLAWAYGSFGGVLGGLFGSGGFVYAAFLHAHLPEREAYRATQAAMISLSTLWRIVLCGATGLLDRPLALTAVALLPTVYLGMALGVWLDRSLPAKAFVTALHLFLIASGLALIARAT
jgi:uncharacterized membrane protein YfcA